MSDFSGKRCDRCGAVVARDANTKFTRRFEGEVNGEYHEDLCPKCAGEAAQDLDLKPLRRRKSRTPDAPATT